MRRRRWAAAGLALVVVGGLAVPVLRDEPPPVRSEVLQVPGVPEPDGRPVSLDATLFLPERDGPRPAVLLAHGFGGSKADLVGQAQDLARDGYVVLTWSARGFGASGGLVHVDAPDFEVADARRLVDLLAERPEVLADGPGDPRVGAVGASYGGGLSLLLGGLDPRVDAVVAGIAWHDLGEALFPGGVLKRGWAGVLFGAAGLGPCGRFAPDVCAAYAASAQAGRPAGGIEALLEQASPARVLGRYTAPTLLLQGQTDSLFDLGQSQANADGIAATGTPVRQVWFDGGHDGGDQEVDRLRGLTRDWLGTHLARDGSASDDRLQITTPAPPRISEREEVGSPEVRVVTGPSSSQSVALQGGAQSFASPPGGTPAALTSLPGVGGSIGPALDALGGALSRLPGQIASFDSAVLTQRTRVTGSSTVRLRVSSTSGDATLFASLVVVDPDGGVTLPRRLVTPLRLTGLPAEGREVDVPLPSVVLDVPPGSRLRVTLASTDQAFAVPTDARAYEVALAGDRAVSLPQLPTAPVDGGSDGRRLLVAGAVGALLLGLVAGLVLRRRRVEVPDADLLAVPLVIEGLGKAYAGGFRAVSDLSFRVEPGQVLGLLGPNGAGKTTTLRMLMGLILPTEGSLTVFGHRVTPGAPVLSRLGAFVKGAGFLPHLSGRDNLELYWRATGRPAEQAQLETVLEVAGLGEDVHRRVRTYSQGMRQRLAIAQAMLGLPELLVLDEPTNGLDPPQIREMRDVLLAYAASGRTVLVSSHLLGEVEQTCSHVVVMHHGRLVAQGPVAELVGSATAVAIDTDDPARAAEVAASLAGATDITTTPTGIALRLLGTPRSELTAALVAAGVAVDRIAPQRGLEEAFLALIGEQA